MKCLFVLAAAGIAAAPQASAAASPVTQASLQQFGKCAAADYDGAELLATQPGSEEEVDVLAEFERRQCGPGTVEPALLRGAVAEHLFKADFGAIGSRSKRGTLEIFTLDEADLDGVGDEIKRRFDVVAFGTCVAAANPELAHALLGSNPGSAAESAAAAALQPGFSPCLEDGEQLSIAKPQLRGALAEGAYRVAVSFAMNRDIVVTGTADASRKVKCKVRPAAGSYFGRKTCMTSEQWAAREREEKIEVLDYARRLMEADEMQALAAATALRKSGAQ